MEKRPFRESKNRIGTAPFWPWRYQEGHYLSSNALERALRNVNRQGRYGAYEKTCERYLIPFGKTCAKTRKAEKQYERRKIDSTRGQPPTEGCSYINICATIFGIISEAVVRDFRSAYLKFFERLFINCLSPGFSINICLESSRRNSSWHLNNSERNTSTMSSRICL